MKGHNEGTALYDRLEDIVTSRLAQMARAVTEPDEQSVQSLASHIIVRDALKRFMDDHPRFFD